MPLPQDISPPYLFWAKSRSLVLLPNTAPTNQAYHQLPSPDTNDTTMAPEHKVKPRRAARKPAEESTGGALFEFISVQSPEDAKDREKRRQARSHALKHSLRNKRLAQSESGDGLRWTAWHPNREAEPATMMSLIKSGAVKTPLLYSPSASIPDPFGTLAVDSSRLRQLFSHCMSIL